MGRGRWLGQCRALRGVPGENAWCASGRPGVAALQDTRSFSAKLRRRRGGRISEISERMYSARLLASRGLGSPTK